jgi:hypothetical protein
MALSKPVRAALALSLLAIALRALDRPGAPPSAQPTPAAASEPRSSAPEASAAPLSGCGPGTLPDHGVCVPVPAGSDRALDTAFDRRARGRAGNHIARKPDRPHELARYRWPLADRSLIDLIELGTAGAMLPAAPGTEVKLVALEQQSGKAHVQYAGELVGKTVITRHVVREGAAEREYLLLFGSLAHLAEGVRAGSTLATGTVLGSVGDSAAPGRPQLYFEIRRPREGVALTELAPRELVHDAKTLSCDPRNVLELLPR